MGNLTGYVGTYASPGSLGLYRFVLNTGTGKLTKPELFYRADNAKCASLWGGLLAVPLERDGKAGLCLLDTGTPGARVEEAFCETQTACFVAQDRRRVFTANYHEGQVLVYDKEDGLKLEKRIEIAPKAGCHQVLFHENYLLVPCLEQDVIRIFDRAADYAPAGELAFPPGSGPRHGVFDRAHERLWVVAERGNRVFSFRVGPGLSFEALGSASALPPQCTAEHPSAAAIRLSDDERFLYVSVRGADLIGVFRADGGAPRPVQFASCGGRHPRDFLIVPGGELLLVVNRTSNDLISFRLDPQTGLLGEPVAKALVHEGVGLALEE